MKNRQWKKDFIDSSESGQSLEKGEHETRILRRLKPDAGFKGIGKVGPEADHMIFHDDKRAMNAARKLESKGLIHEHKKNTVGVTFKYGKKSESVNKSESLEKGALKTAGIALGMAGALAGGHAGAANRSPASIQHPSVQAKSPSYNHSKMLNAIMQVESSGGTNTKHTPTANGTAYGKWALMPGTIKDTIKAHKDLKTKHGKALALTGDSLNRYMSDNKGLEDVIANRHLSHLERHFKSPEDIGFAWNQGITGTNRAKNQKFNISGHPYVKKIRDAYSKGK